MSEIYNNSLLKGLIKGVDVLVNLGKVNLDEKVAKALKIIQKDKIIDTEKLISEALLDYDITNIDKMKQLHSVHHNYVDLKKVELPKKIKEALDILKKDKTFDYDDLISSALKKRKTIAIADELLKVKESKSVHDDIENDTKKDDTYVINHTKSSENFVKNEVENSVENSNYYSNSDEKEVENV